MTYTYPDPEEQPLTPARLADVWRRRKWTGIVIFLASAAGAGGVVLALPDLYRASAKVIVEREVSQDFVRPTVSAELETRIQSIHEQVMSREHLLRVIEELNVYPDRRSSTPPQELVRRMNRDVTLDLTGVERTTGGMATVAFEIGFTGREPRLVAAVANRLAETYVQENGDSRRRQAAATAEVLRKELETVKKQLDEQETRSRTFAMTYTDELPQQLEANLAALERLQSQLSTNGQQQLRLIERRERIEQEMLLGRMLVPAGDPNAPAARLQALRQQLDVLRRTFSDEYPDVKRVRNEIAVLEAEVAAGAKAAGAERPADPVAQRKAQIAAVESDLAALEREADSLRRSIARYESLVNRAPRRQLEMEQLTSGTSLNRQRYEALLKQYEDAQLAATAEAGDSLEHFRVLNPAVPPAWPVGPNRLMLAAMGLAAALVLAVLGIVVREKMDPSLHVPDDLRGLVPEGSVVAVRRIRTRRDRRRAIPRAALATVGTVVLAALCAGAAYYFADDNEQIVRLTLRGDS